MAILCDSNITVVKLIYGVCIQQFHQTLHKAYTDIILRLYSIVLMRLCML